jgi:hypothetical protein
MRGAETTDKTDFSLKVNRRVFSVKKRKFKVSGNKLLLKDIEVNVMAKDRGLIREVREVTAKIANLFFPNQRCMMRGKDMFDGANWARGGRREEVPRDVDWYRVIMVIFGYPSRERRVRGFPRDISIISGVNPFDKILDRGSRMT